MTKHGLLLGAAAVTVAAIALGGGYFLGKHAVGAAYADVDTTPQMLASASGAPAVPGLCVLSQNAIYVNAKVGQAATARYRQLTASLRGQLEPEQKAIQQAAGKLEAAKSSMPAAQYQQQAQALAARVQNLRTQSGQDNRNLEATRVKALRQIAALANPLIGEAYKAHHCGAIFSRETMLVGNPGMDLTSQVVQGLDARTTTISFELEHLPPQAAQAQ
jgi:Skp family chaperone for outer membrane proteins